MEHLIYLKVNDSEELEEANVIQDGPLDYQLDLITYVSRGDSIKWEFQPNLPDRYSIDALNFINNGLFSQTPTLANDWTGIISLTARLYEPGVWPTYTYIYTIGYGPVDGREWFWDPKIRVKPQPTSE